MKDSGITISHYIILFNRREDNMINIFGKSIKELKNFNFAVNNLLNCYFLNAKISFFYQSYLVYY